MKTNDPYVKRTLFRFEDDKVEVIIEDTPSKFRWRMVVNGSPSPWTSFYEGILRYKGYCLATTYWASILIPFKPFKPIYAVEESSVEE